MMTCSRLLTSCAAPPVNCPTASMFCAWRSASSFLAQLLRSFCDLLFEPGVELNEGLLRPLSFPRSHAAWLGTPQLTEWSCLARKPARCKKLQLSVCVGKLEPGCSGPKMTGDNLRCSA